MKISVVTIVLNAVATLEQTINSVLDQKYPDLEYVIIDGGSTDGTLDIIKKYESQLSFWCSEKDSGISDAFNKGIHHCSGELIGLLNADDWYESGALSRMAQVAESEPRIGIFCGRTQFWEKGSPTYIFHADPSRVEKETTIGHQAVFVRKSVYDKYGLYRTDKRYAGDYDFFLRTKLAGVEFKTLDFVVANMRSDGVSDRHWPKVYREVMEVQQQHLHSKLKPYLRYRFKLIRTTTSRFLSASGFEGVVSFYRRYFSVLRKDRVPSATPPTSARPK